jgi:hypothetical protein
VILEELAEARHDPSWRLAISGLRRPMASKVLDPVLVLEPLAGELNAKSARQGREDLAGKMGSQDPVDWVVAPSQDDEASVRVRHARKRGSALTLRQRTKDHALGLRETRFWHRGRPFTLERVGAVRKSV